jgi:arsenate reductase
LCTHVLRTARRVNAVIDRPYNVLFLCTGNSARSIMAEALLNHWSRGQFKGFSAGSQPTGTVHPVALELLDRMRVAHEGARSKDWSEFAQQGAPEMDFVFTVCDRAAAEVGPVWPGQPMTAHWAVEDPAIAQEKEADKWIGFRQAFKILGLREIVWVTLGHFLINARATCTSGSSA